MPIEKLRLRPNQTKTTSFNPGFVWPGFNLGSLIGNQQSEISNRIMLDPIIYRKLVKKGYLQEGPYQLQDVDPVIRRKLEKAGYLPKDYSLTEAHMPRMPSGEIAFQQPTVGEAAVQEVFGLGQLITHPRETAERAKAGILEARRGVGELTRRLVTPLVPGGAALRGKTGLEAAAEQVEAVKAVGEAAKQPLIKYRHPVREFKERPITTSLEFAWDLSIVVALAGLGLKAGGGALRIGRTAPIITETGEVAAATTRVARAGTTAIRVGERMVELSNMVDPTFPLIRGFERATQRGSVIISTLLERKALKGAAKAASKEGLKKAAMFDDAIAGVVKIAEGEKPGWGEILVDELVNIIETGGRGKAVTHADIIDDAIKAKKTLTMTYLTKGKDAKVRTITEMRWAKGKHTVSAVDSISGKRRTFSIRNIQDFEGIQSAPTDIVREIYGKWQAMPEDEQRLWYAINESAKRSIEEGNPRAAATLWDEIGKKTNMSREEAMNYFLGVKEKTGEEATERLRQLFDLKGKAPEEAAETVAEALKDAGVVDEVAEAIGEDVATSAVQATAKGVTPEQQAVMRTLGYTEIQIGNITSKGAARIIDDNISAERAEISSAGVLRIQKAPVEEAPPVALEQITEEEILPVPFSLPQKRVKDVTEAQINAILKEKELEAEGVAPEGAVAPREEAPAVEEAPAPPADKTSLGMPIYHATLRKFEGLPKITEGLLGERRRAYGEPDGVFYNVSESVAKQATGMGEKQRVIKATINTDKIFEVNAQTSEKYDQLFKDALREVGGEEAVKNPEDYFLANYGKDIEVSEVFSGKLRAQGYDAVFKTRTGDFITLTDEAVTPVEPPRAIGPEAPVEVKPPEVVEETLLRDLEGGTLDPDDWATLVRFDNKGIQKYYVTEAMALEAARTFSSKHPEYGVEVIHRGTDGVYRQEHYIEAPVVEPEVPAEVKPPEVEGVPTETVGIAPRVEPTTPPEITPEMPVVEPEAPIEVKPPEIIEEVAPAPPEIPETAMDALADIKKQIFAVLHADAPEVQVVEEAIRKHLPEATDAQIKTITDKYMENLTVQAADPVTAQAEKEETAGVVSSFLKSEEGFARRPTRQDMKRIVDTLKAINRGERVGEITESVKYLLGHHLVTPEMVLNSQGPAGRVFTRELRLIDSRYKAEAGRIAYDVILPVRKELTDLEWENMVDVLEGKADPFNEKVEAATEKLRKEYDKVADEWIRLKGTIRIYDEYGKPHDIPFKKRENYFQHSYPAEMFKDKEFMDEIVEQLAEEMDITEVEARKIIEQARMDKTGMRMGNIEMARQTDMPGYRRDAGSVIRYFTNAWKRVELSRSFGPKYEKFDDMIDTIKEDGGDPILMREVFGIYTGNIPMSEGLRKHVLPVTRQLKRFQILTKMGRAAIANFFEGQNIPMAFSWKTNMQGIFDWRTKKGRRQLDITGAVIHDAIRHIGTGAEKDWVFQIGAPVFTVIERNLRRVAAASGGRWFKDNEVKLRRAIKKGAKRREATARRALKRWGFDPDDVLENPLGLPENDKRMREGMNRAADFTQKAYGALDIPPGYMGPYGSGIAQFKSWSLMQAKFKMDTAYHSAVEAFGHGNFMPLARWLVAIGVFVTTGEAVNELRSWLYHRERTGLYGGIAKSELTKKEIVNLVIQDYLAVTSLGQMSIILEALEYGDPFGAVLGPLAGDISAVERMARKPSTVTKELLKRVPVVGAPAASWIFPYQKKKKKGLKPIGKKRPAVKPLGGK